MFETINGANKTEYEDFVSLEQVKKGYHPDVPYEIAWLSFVY